MDRIREARRTTMATNGLTRRRHRTNSLRDSPEDDGAMELQEPTRLRDRGSGKKDRDRERERDRLGRSKRRRGDRLMHSSREDGGEDTSEESVNDEDDDDDDVGGSVRMLPLNPSLSSSSSLSNHRKSFPPAKVFKPTPPKTWKAADEMIGVSVPRKARSASTKRSPECWTSSGGGIVPEKNHRQPSNSPVSAAAAAASPAPASPSSSNASVRKKIKQNGGPKFRPPKSSSKSSSSAQDEIEIEIAEVLYGMMRQPQGPSKQEIIVNDSIKFEANKSSTDGKSPISNSQSAPPQNSISPMSAVAPKRKRPRPLKHEDENPSIFSVRSSPISTTTKAESDQPSKMETCLPKLDKNSPPENLTNSQPVQSSSEPIRPDSNTSSDSKSLKEESEKQKEVVPPQSPKKESPVLQVVDDDREDVKVTKANPTMPESETQREEKFQIDLMAPPPPLRSSPERDAEINLVVDAQKEVKPVVKEGEKSLRMNKEEVVIVEMEKVRAKAEEAESQKLAVVQKERGIDLQLDLEKADKVDTNGNVNMINKKQHQNVQRQQQTNSEKNVQSNSLPLPMSVPSWPGGLPPMGYMTPLQGVVSMDGTTVTSAPIPPPHLLFNQPRPKRCATHFYIARNISYHQQIARMNPFWPAAAGSASLYGPKPGNLNVVPTTEFHGNIPGKAANSTQDKGHGLAMFPGHIGRDKASQPANVDNSSRKQILLPQGLPPGAAPPPSNLLHAPAFIFPLNQQQAAAAASVRPGSVKSLPVTSNGAPSCTSNSAPPNASCTGASPTMSFSYPNIPANEAQYLAILQNNAYPFPIPAHVGGPPAAYRGTPHAQAFPFFSGSFYSSQMLHPSQIQQQQLPAAQSQQSQQGHHNTSISSGSSSSQKHAQNLQQKPNNASASNGGGGGSLQGFPITKNPSLQQLQLQQQQQQQRQQLQNHHTTHPARQFESEMGSEDSPSTADSRLNRAAMNIYGQNFAMPMQTPNFALMTPASISGAGSNGGHNEKKQPQQQQHPSPKAGGETSPAFAISFASINGATAASGLDLSSIAQNHSIMQSTHNYQMMAAAQAASAQLKKNYHTPEEGKNVVNSSNLDEDRKVVSGKIPATVGQSIAFARPDVSDPSITSLAGNNVIDSSGRNLNIGSASSRGAVSVMPAAINTNAVTSQQQMQRNHQQFLQLHKQNQFAAAAAAAAASRNKTPSTSNGSVYSENLPSTSSMATKFPSAVSAFPQSLVQSSSSTVSQSPQWKNSARVTTTSQSPPSMASSQPSSVKTLPQQQQQGRSQQAHTQISFAANPKSSTAQVQPASSNQSPSPPVMVGSPTTSSMSKNTSSPRTTSTSTNNKITQTSSLSSQQAKNSPSGPTRKSSPVGGRNVPPILSGPQLTPSSSTGTKPQLPQQSQKQQQISKQTLPQAQLFFSNSYMHSQVSQSNSSASNASAASGFYFQRRGHEQMQRQGSSGTSSNGAAVNNTKGSALPSQGLVHPAQFAAMPPSGNHHQFVPSGFTYVHPVPTAVQMKPEQKQPAGE
ncbi:protein TIME FOR COFFEE-like [Gastrolobium bilobum]|uniref:protein TIME FOR COFFEE-like n=1 Tax=Gastrolobium bilobum TaxID=150636 RepID=UPI002AAF706E|nr:protein TIME FOR COFFEE-like [Gastrolobium bilobum]